MLSFFFGRSSWVGSGRRAKRPSVSLAFDSLEPRIALHGSPIHRAVPIEPAATDPGTAASQVLATASTSLNRYEALQGQLDSLATKIQNQSTTARQAGANHAKMLVTRFIKQENKGFKQVQALAGTVTGSAVFTAAVQFEQGVHSALLSVKTQVLPQFRLLVRAQFSSAKPASRGDVADSVVPSGVLGHVTPSSIHTAEITPEDAEEISFGLLNLAASMSNTLIQIANSPNASCAFVASHSLRSFNTILDVALVFYQSLSPLLSDDVNNDFVRSYNSLVTRYNAAVVQTNAILAANTITTH